MKSIIGSILGFEWIQNVMLKNAARAGAAALVALGAKSAPVGAIMASFGLSGDNLATGLAAIGVMILGAIRGWSKPKVEEQPK